MEKRIKETIYPNKKPIFTPQHLTLGLFWVDYADSMGATEFDDIDKCREWLHDEDKPPVIIIHDV